MKNKYAATNLINVGARRKMVAALAHRGSIQEGRKASARAWRVTAEKFRSITRKIEISTVLTGMKHLSAARPAKAMKRTNAVHVGG